MPSTMQQWVLQGNTGFDDLKLVYSPVPEVSGKDVLIKLHALSLNYRDLMIAKGTYYWSTKPGVVPGSDGAGEVVAVGDKVTRFNVGQRVIAAHFQGFISGTLSTPNDQSSLGGPTDGVFREYAVFDEQGLVLMPDNLSFREAATLPCSALTAWNCLYGGNVKPLKPGDTVLVQGTGGVSISALQFAKISGAEVIATTSDAHKEELLKKLGARHVINYKTEKNWGQVAKDISLGKRGADYIVEIGGPNTLGQSCVAGAIDGVIAIVGTRGGQDGDGGRSHTTLSMLRRILVGSRLQLEDMIRAIVVNDIKPVIDSKIFKFSEIREAYQYMEDSKHIGKIVVDVF